MPLAFERRSLIKSLGFLAALLAFFMAVGAYALWVDEPGAKRSLMLLMMPLGGAICVYAIANGLWLIASKSPVAVITGEGIRIQSIFSKKTIPWSKLGQVGRGFMAAGKRKIEVIEIMSDKFNCIRRFPVSSLDGSQTEVDEWIASAQSEIAAARAS